jgi:hypothetical protein
MILIGIFFLIEFLLSFDLVVPYTVNGSLSVNFCPSEIKPLQFLVISLDDYFWVWSYPNGCLPIDYFLWLLSTNMIFCIDFS